MLNIDALCADWNNIRYFGHTKLNGFTELMVDDSYNLSLFEDGAELALGYGYLDGDKHDRGLKNFLTHNCKACVRSPEDYDQATKRICAMITDPKIDFILFQDFEFDKEQLLGFADEGYSFVFVPTLLSPRSTSGMLILNKVGEIDAVYCYTDSLSFAHNSNSYDRNANYIQLAAVVGEYLIVNVYTNAFTTYQQRIDSHDKLLDESVNLANRLGKKLIVAGDFNTYGKCTNINSKCYSLSFLPNILETLFLKANRGNIIELNELSKLAREGYGLIMQRSAYSTFEKRIPFFDKEVGWVLSFVIGGNRVDYGPTILPQTTQDHHGVRFSLINN